MNTAPVTQYQVYMVTKKGAVTVNEEIVVFAPNLDWLNQTFPRTGNPATATLAPFRGSDTTRVEFRFEQRNVSQRSRTQWEVVADPRTI